MNQIIIYACRIFLYLLTLTTFFMAGTVTIVDLARELKISPSTVSRALRDHPAIKNETKILVQELAKKAWIPT